MVVVFKFATKLEEYFSLLFFNSNSYLQLLSVYHMQDLTMYTTTYNNTHDAIFRICT